MYDRKEPQVGEPRELVGRDPCPSWYPPNYAPGGRIDYCERERGHEEMHRATVSAGGPLEWWP